MPRSHISFCQTRQRSDKGESKGRRQEVRVKEMSYAYGGVGRMILYTAWIIRDSTLAKNCLRSGGCIAFATTSALTSLGGAFRVLFDLEGARWRIDRSVLGLAALLEFVIARDSYSLTS